MEIRANSGKLVPVLLKPSFVSGYELLIKAREACRVPSANPFLFGCPRALSAYRPATCIQLYAIKCGAKDPKLLSLLKIRRHFRTMLQLINLDKDEAEQILGPGNQLRRLKHDSDLLLDDSEMYLDGKQGAADTTELSKIEPRLRGAPVPIPVMGIGTNTGLETSTHCKKFHCLHCSETFF